MDEQERNAAVAAAQFMDEMQAKIIDPGLILMEPVQCHFLFFPIKTMPPMGAQFAQVGHVRSIFPAATGDLVGPAGPPQSLTEVLDDIRGDADGERLDIHIPNFGAIPAKTRPPAGRSDQIRYQRVTSISNQGVSTCPRVR